MPQYRVLEKSYLPDGTKTPEGAPTGMCRIYEAGETVNYDGLPGGNLEPIDDEGKAKQAEYLDSLAQVRKDRAASAAVQDPGVIAEKVLEAIEAGITAGIAKTGKGKG